MPLFEGNNRSPDKETIGHLFSRAVQDNGARNLIVSDLDGSIFTYADSAEVVRRIMSKFIAGGVNKGDVICVYAPLKVESFLLFWAAASMGVVFVPLDLYLPEKKLGRIFGQVDPKIIFCERKDLPVISAIKEQAKVVFFDRSAESDHHQGPPSFSQWIDGDIGEVSVPEPVPDDSAVILYTSGSTGEPKGVVLSQGALYRSGRLIKELFCWRPDDLLLSLGEMHAMSGLRNPGVAILHAGGSFLVTSPALRSDLFALAECIQKYRCTQLSTVPVVIRHFVQFRDRIPVPTFASLRSVQSAGSALTQQLLDAFWGHFHIPVLNYYGLTETTGLCIGHSRESFQQADGSIGLPVGCIAEVVDANGTVVADGLTGELRIRSNNLMLGYYRDRERTDTMIRDGWLYTGDLAMKRPDGHIVLMGRMKDVIKHANGDLISLEEVEQAIERHQGVREAAVCGYNASRGDERMAAFVVPHAAPEQAEEFFRDLRRHLRDELGPAKVPAEFILKDTLPRGSMGKVLREQLKQEVGDL